MLTYIKLDIIDNLLFFLINVKIIQLCKRILINLVTFVTSKSPLILYNYRYLTREGIKLYIENESVIGSNALVDSIIEQGGSVVFGCFGEELFPTNHQNNDVKQIKFVRMQHEQAAVHAADGFARACGEPGIAIITTGSGITNAVTGIATAHSDSVPLVVLMLQTPSTKEMDMESLTMSITKHYFKMNATDSFQQIICESFHIAKTGRPAPVIVEIPVELLKNQTYKKQEWTELSLNDILSKSSQDISKQQITNVIEILQQAKKPMIMVGGGTLISDSSELLRTFVTKTNIPVVSTMMGMGAMDSKDKLFLGMLGMHGTFAANKAVHNCDVLLCLGVRFSDRVTGKPTTFSPKSTKIQIDIDAAEINKIIQVDLPIIGDIKEFLSELNYSLDADLNYTNWSQWVDQVTNYKKTVPRFEHVNSIIKPQEVIRLLDQYSNQNCIVVTDVGQHQIFTVHHFSFTQPRTFISSGGLGTMGYGLPAAIGASFAKPDMTNHFNYRRW